MTSWWHADALFADRCCQQAKEHYERGDHETAAAWRDLGDRGWMRAEAVYVNCTPAQTATGSDAEPDLQQRYESVK